MPAPATAIAAHTHLKGELHLDGPGVIAGKIEGNILAAEELEIAPEAVITGGIRGATIIVHGTVKGNLNASRECRLGATARVAGDICTASLTIAEGARFIGQVCIGSAETAIKATPEATVDAAQEMDAIKAVDATLQRIEAAASRIKEATPISMPSQPMPTVEVFSQNVQAVLQRGTRIIKAR